MPVNGETIPEQVGYIQKHTDNADLTEDFVSPIEQTTTFNEKQYRKEIAKSKVEIEEMATGRKEAKASIQVKVKLIRMKIQAKSKLNYIHHFKFDFITSIFYLFHRIYNHLEHI